MPVGKSIGSSCILIQNDNFGTIIRWSINAHEPENESLEVHTYIHILEKSNIITITLTFPVHIGRSLVTEIIASSRFK